jgi:DNA-binding MarR family transcriptional regulator
MYFSEPAIPEQNVMTKPTAIPLEGQLCFSLYRANLEVGRAYQSLFDTLGITYPQLLVLNTLWEKDRRTVGDIAIRLGLESSNVTPLIKRLETAGLLTRQRNPADDRQVLVQLTAEGQAIQQRCTFAETLFKASGMEGEKLLALNDAIQELLKSMEKTKVSTN